MMPQEAVDIHKLIRKAFPEFPAKLLQQIVDLILMYDDKTEPEEAKEIL